MNALYELFRGYQPVIRYCQYSISSKDIGVWTSNKDGEVYLEHLKVGLTNLIIKDDPDYFDQVINGAKVFKGEKSV